MASQYFILLLLLILGKFIISNFISLEMNTQLVKFYTYKSVFPGLKSKILHLMH